MRLVNLTPHPVIYKTENTAIIFHPSGVVARVDTLPAPEWIVDVEGYKVVVSGPPVAGTTINLPQPDPDTLYIVSLVVRQAKPDRKDLISPGTGPNDGAIRDADGKIIAVTRFISNA